MPCVTIAAARGIVQVMEASRLAKNGGPATLSVPWAKSLLKRMDFRKRRVQQRVEQLLKT